MGCSCADFHLAGLMSAVRYCTPYTLLYTVYTTVHRIHHTSFFETFVDSVNVSGSSMLFIDVDIRLLLSYPGSSMLFIDVDIRLLLSRIVRVVYCI